MNTNVLTETGAEKGQLWQVSSIGTLPTVIFGLLRKNTGANLFKRPS